MEAYAEVIEIMNINELTNDDINGLNAINEFGGADEVNGIDEYDMPAVLEADGETPDSETAGLIARWLVAKYRSKLIYDCIDDVFGKLDTEDRDEVYRSVCDIISCRYKLKHLEYIKGKLLEFFEHDNRMNIDGFINFRLKAYKEELRMLVEECGCDILGDREYKDYIELLDILDILMRL